MAVARRPHRCYAVAVPGTAPLIASELEQLGLGAGRIDRGGVAFRASDRELYHANVWLRGASRVLVRVASFDAYDFAGLEEAGSQVDLAPYLAGAPVTIRVTSSGSKLYHTDAVAQRLYRSMKVREAVEGEESQLIVARLSNNRLTLSMDTSGEHLHRRGWRQATAKAPIRETLAACVLGAVGWDGSAALIDPMCGSGTFPIEAARLAQGRAPSPDRSFAFQQWPSFAPGSWGSVSAAVAAAEKSPRPIPSIVGSDRDAGAVEAATANAARAGVDDVVEFHQRAVSAVERPECDPGWMVTNPPYGRRVGAKTDLRDLYASIGSLFKGPLKGWSVAMLSDDERLANHSGLKLEGRLQIRNGGIAVECLATP